MIAESAVLKLGSTIAGHAAKAWLQRRKTRFERGASLAELAQVELKGPLRQRKLSNLVERIGNQVAEQVAPVIEQRFGDVPEHEAEAAVLAVVDVLEGVDLSDRGLLAADADAEVLARQVRRQFPGRAGALSERAALVHELALDQACRHLVQVVRYLPSFQPTALAEVLGRLTAQADQLDQLLARTPVTSLYAPAGTDRDEEFRAEYLRHVANVLDRLELLGLPGDEQPRLALTVAYLSLSVSGGGRRTRPHPMRWLDRQPGREAEGVPVEAAIGERTRVLLRGEAGSGKTTLLNWLAVRAARGELSGPLAEWNGRVPFVVRLRSHAEGDLPMPERFPGDCAAPIADLAPAGWVHRLLRAGEAMLLVDGVDEVPAARRRAVKVWLRELLQAFPDVRVVVTSRTAAADSRWLADDGFSAVTLEPMNSANISVFVERWHEAAELPGSSAERRMRSQLERPHLRELAGSPLLCAMLCALNLSHRSELPRNRMDLYAKALAMLLHLRDAERGIAGLLSDTEKRVLLRDLAWRLTLANKVEFPAPEVLEHIARKLPAMPDVDAEAEVLFKHLLERSGVLREPVPGRIDFVHRTFLEYLAADEAIQQHHIGTLVAHAHLDTWWETVVMACGHATAKQASELLTGVLNRAEEEPSGARHLRLLAAACLETVKDISPEVRARIDAMVGAKLVPPRSLRETQSLASIGHRVLRYLPTSLDGLSEAQAAATVRAAALTATTEALPLLGRYAQDSREKVQQELWKAWHYFDPELFSEEVLADSPLHNGRLRIDSTRFLEHVHRVRSLSSLEVFLPAYRPVRDLNFTSGVPRLTALKFWSASVIDLASLGVHAELVRLEVSHASGFDGMSALGELPLRLLSLGSLAGQTDLAPIGEMATLRTLHLEKATVEGIRSLGEMSHIGWASLFNCDISPDSVVRAFPLARGLNCVHGAPLDLARFVELPLEFLILQNVEIEDLSAVTRMAGLRELSLWRVNFDRDLTPLRDTNLKKLTLPLGEEFLGLGALSPSLKISYWG
ncbi:NACHT domain-containing protein [Saccharothrix syringae]|uniref:NACHT domain-containing protein n=1 Tax=Saccharothrix syringae TaxID=103733 RepID=A0A5Q0GRV1_SACSY|nr:NACHT domain-containing protein [Saccharothrix syringae]QFZ16092.1 NACHT domain-containing protein [Saccharothrix syringae]